MENKNGITDANSGPTNDNMTAQAIEEADNEAGNAASVPDDLAAREAERSLEANAHQQPRGAAK